MATSTNGGQEPLAKDYEGTRADQTLKAMSGNTFTPDGDHLKAAKVIYEVTVGEGVGEGKVGEMFLPLGKEMGARVKLVRDRLDHCLEVFGDIANNVSVDK